MNPGSLVHGVGLSLGLRETACLPGPKGVVPLVALALLVVLYNFFLDIGSSYLMLNCLLHYLLVVVRCCLILWLYHFLSYYLSVWHIAV